MDKFFDYFNIYTIKSRLSMYSLLITFMVLLTSIFTFYNSESFSNKMNSMFVNNKKLTEIYKGVEEVDKELLDYLNSKNTDSYDNYFIKSDDLKNELDKSNQSISLDNSSLLLRDIRNMINEYLSEGEEAMRARRAENIDEYNSRYQSAEKIKGYIKVYMSKLNEKQFELNTEKYFYMADNVKKLKALNLIILGVTVILNVLVIISFTNKISTPIVKLSHAAEEISKGNFKIDDVSIDVVGEVKIMSEAFNKMKNNINSYIQQLKEQSEIESKLMEEKMNNLKMKNLLKNAQISALQSQINPHFLFNTLNAGVQLAMMENAERTGILLEKLSSIFRYNLSKTDRIVPLRDEIQNLYSYIYILQTRFGDLIDFKVNVQEECLKTLVPSMSIQPLIENACIHGVGDMEEGAQVCLNAYLEYDYTKIIVSDNGKGISQDKILRILREEENTSNESVNASKKTKGHTTGIGLRNVIKRIRLYCDNDDAVIINSKEGCGTEIIFKIPRESGEGNV